MGTADRQVGLLEEGGGSPLPAPHLPLPPQVSDGTGWPGTRPLNHEPRQTLPALSYSCWESWPQGRQAAHTLGTGSQALRHPVQALEGLRGGWRCWRTAAAPRDSRACTPARSEHPAPREALLAPPGPDQTAGSCAKEGHCAPHQKPGVAAQQEDTDGAQAERALSVSSGPRGPGARGSRALWSAPSAVHRQLPTWGCRDELTQLPSLVLHGQESARRRGSEAAEPRLPGPHPGTVGGSLEVTEARCSCRGKS